MISLGSVVKDSQLNLIQLEFEFNVDELQLLAVVLLAWINQVSIIKLIFF
jgi:hypothetical protein